MYATLLMVKSLSSGGLEENANPGKDGTMTLYGKLSGEYFSCRRDKIGRNSRKLPENLWRVRKSRSLSQDKIIKYQAIHEVAAREPHHAFLENNDMK